MAQGLGTISWMARTGGKIAWHDRLTLIAQGVRAKAARKRNIRNNVKFRHREIEDILPPDSAMVREATSLSQEASDAFLFNHCLRSYFWARLLDDGTQSFDDEALFTALMFHDMGLTDKHRLQGDKIHCFTQVGANLADKLARDHGWSEKRADLTANAITLHLNISIGDKHGREAQLVRIGSFCDVAGLGLEYLEQDQIDGVITRYPRLGLKEKLIPALKIETDQRPCCRIAFMNNKLGLGALIQKSRFAE